MARSGKSMIESSDDLWQELSLMADSFADLGRRLLHASRELVSPGVVPNADLLEQVGQLRSAFESARARIYQTGIALDLALPAPQTVHSLKRLATLLDAIEDAEARNQEAMAQVAHAPTETTERMESLPEANDIADVQPQQAISDPETVAEVEVESAFEAKAVSVPVAAFELAAAPQSEVVFESERAPVPEAVPELEAVLEVAVLPDAEVVLEQSALPEPMAAPEPMATIDEETNDDAVLGEVFEPGALEPSSGFDEALSEETSEPPLIAEPEPTFAVVNETLDDAVEARDFEPEMPKPSPVLDDDLGGEIPEPPMIAEPEPAFAALTSDALLSSVVTEALPYIPRSLSVRLTGRRLGRVAQQATSHSLKLWEPVRLQAGGSMIEELATEGGAATGNDSARQDPAADGTDKASGSTTAGRVASWVRRAGWLGHRTA
jgi:hypothetical protein